MTHAEWNTYRILSLVADELASLGATRQPVQRALLAVNKRCPCQLHPDAVAVLSLSATDYAEPTDAELEQLTAGWRP